MGVETTLKSPLAEAVRQAGSQSAFARIIGRSQPTIYSWLVAGKRLPAEHVADVERSLGIPRSRLRPDLFEIGDTTASKSAELAEANR